MFPYMVLLYGPHGWSIWVLWRHWWRHHVLSLSILNALHHKRACLLALQKFLLALRDGHYSDICTDSYERANHVAYRLVKFEVRICNHVAAFNPATLSLGGYESLTTCLPNLKSVTVSKLHWNNNLTIPIFCHRDKRLTLIISDNRLSWKNAKWCWEFPNVTAQTWR